MIKWFTADAPVGQGMLREFWWFSSRLVTGTVVGSGAFIAALYAYTLMAATGGL